MAAAWWRLWFRLSYFTSEGLEGGTPGEQHALFHVPPPTDCCGSLKRPFLLLVCLCLTFALCVVRLQHSRQALSLCT